jgi:hypothetical protein
MRAYAELAREARREIASGCEVTKVAVMAEWAQMMHGFFQAHIATRKCCSLSVIGSSDLWVWIVRRSKRGGTVEAKERTFNAAKAAAEETARRLAGDLPLNG